MSRVRRWVFTLNNPESVPPLFIEWWTSVPPQPVAYCVVQLEEGEQGTRHLQGLVCFTKALYLSNVKKLPGLERAHWEPMRGTLAQAKEYCTKDETRVSGPWEFGEAPVQGQRSDLLALKSDIDLGVNLSGLLEQHSIACARFHKYMFMCIGAARSERAISRYEEFASGGENGADVKKTVTVLYGPSRTGKTSLVFEMHDMRDVYPLRFGDGSKGSLWFDDYQDQDYLLIDDFYGQIKFTRLLSLCDIYPDRVQAKGFSFGVNFKGIYITTNVEPHLWYQGVHLRERLALYKRISEVLVFGESSRRVDREIERHTGDEYFSDSFIQLSQVPVSRNSLRR